MAHQLEVRNGKARMAYVAANGAPWHKLGNPVSNDLTADEMRLIALGEDYTVEMWPEEAVKDGIRIVSPNRFSLVRSTDHQHLCGGVSNIYKPTQPREAFSFFKRFVDAGDFTMETAGSLSDGRRIWALAKLKKGFTLKGGDRMEGYLLLCCPYILGQSFQIKFTAVRVVCHNTLTAALCGGAGFKMSHLHFFDGNMQKHAAEALGLAIEKLDELHAAADILASRKAPVNLVLEYIGRLGGAKLLEAAVVATDATQKIHKGNGSALDAAIDATVAEKHFQQIKEADLNKVGKVFLDSILASPGSDLAAARGTWWGAFNGITHACDFRLGHTADSRLSSAWFGERENTKNKALAMAVEYAQRVN